MAEIETILIVGGGVSGLTLGRALHIRGLRAEIIERSAEWGAEGSESASVFPDGVYYVRPELEMRSETSD